MVIYKGTAPSYQQISQWKLCRPGESRVTFSKCWEIKDCHTRLLCLEKLSFRYKGAALSQTNRSYRCSLTQSCLTLWEPTDRSMPGFPVLHHHLELAQTHVHWDSDAMQPSLPLSSPSAPASSLCSIRVFSSESALPSRCPKYWELQFSPSPSNGHSGLSSFRKDWLDLLAVQGALRSLLQHHSSKASILWCSAFIMVQLSHPYMTTGKP